MLFSVSYFTVNAKLWKVSVSYALGCYVDASSNKQLKQDMRTLMGKLKQQQQSSSAVSGLLHSVLLVKICVGNYFYH